MQAQLMYMLCVFSNVQRATFQALVCFIMTVTAPASF